MSKQTDNIGRPIFVISHRRSGTHLMIDTLRRQFDSCRSWKWFGEYLHHLYLDIDLMRPDHDWYVSASKAARLLSRAERPIVKSHCMPSFELVAEAHRAFVGERFERADRIYMVRDGRQALCSDYYLTAHEDSGAAQCTFSEFLRQPVDGSSRARRWAEHVLEWTSQGSVLMVRYEELTKQPAETLKRIAEHLQLEPRHVEPVLPKAIYGKWQRRWMRLRMRPESSAVSPRYARGRTKKWPEMFTTDDRAYFHEQAGQALMQLGYESSDEWVGARQPETAA